MELEKLNELIGSLNIPSRKDEEWNRSMPSSYVCPIPRSSRSGYAQASRRVWPYYGLLDDVGNNRISALATATAIVFHRYTGQETIPILQELSNSSGEHNGSKFEPTYKIGKAKFNKSSTFDEISAQLNRPEENNNLTFTKTDLRHPGSELSFLFRFGVKTEETRADQYLSYEILLSLLPNPIPSMGIELRVDYKFELYLDTQMERLISHVSRIIENGTAHPQDSIEVLPILGSHEYNTIISDFNGINFPDLDALADDRSLLAVFRANLATRGQNLAFVQDTGDQILSLSYEELHSQSTYLSLSIQYRETQLEINSDFIATFLPQGLPFISTSLAGLMLNKTVGMIHPTYPSKQLESCLATLGNPLLITTRPMVQKISFEYYHRIFFIDEEEEFQNGTRVRGNGIGEAESKIPKRNKNPICLFTSGSTGPPKAVLLTEMAILNTAKFCARNYGFDSTHRAMCIASTGFVISSCDVWAMFFVGGSIQVPPENVRLDLDALIPWIYKQDITNFYASTAIVDAILNNSAPGDVELSKLKWILFAGEKMHRINMRGRTFRCSQLYGSTETFMATACLIPPESDCLPPPAGHSLTNVDVYVLDGHLSPVPIGVKGNVYISGSGVMTGYVNRRPEDIFLPNPFKPGTVIYPMGDIGYWTSGGDLFIVGRNDAQVKIHGMRLNLGEVEAALQSYPAVQQAIVILREVGQAKQVIGFCRLEKDVEEPDLMHVYQFLETRLQRHAIPCQINFVEDFPRTASGKIERKALLKIERKMSVGIAPPLGHHLPWIRKIWAEVIGIPETLVTKSSNFFFLGGNSMIAYKMFHILFQEFPQLKLTQIYEFPRFDKFVDVITSPDANKFADIIHFDQEIKLDPVITSLMENACAVDGMAVGVRFQAENKNSLVTGATGYLGPSLLLELLSSTSDHIMCIVRAKTDEEAEDRLVSHVTEQNLEASFTQFEGSDRLKVLAGDLSEPNFGLAQTDFDKLAKLIDVVYHGAAEVNFIKSYAQLKESTVAMTRNVIQFAVTGKLKWIHYMSTVGVFDGSRLGEGAHHYVAEEGQLPLKDSQPERMSNGYNQSKWVSEQLIWGAAASGVPVTVYRIGELGCDAGAGIVNREDALAGFLLTCKQLEKYPDIKFFIPYISLDKAAKATVALAQSMQARGDSSSFRSVFHIIGKEITFSKFFREEDGEGCAPVPWSDWEADFLENCRDSVETNESLGAWLMHVLIKASEGIRDRGILMKNVSFSTQQTEQQLSGRMSVWDEEDPSSYARILFQDI